MRFLHWLNRFVDEVVHSMWVGIAIVVLSVITVTFSVNAAREAREVTACQTEFNARFVEALRVRDALSLQERAMRDQLIIDVTRAPTGPQLVRDRYIDRVLREYVDSRRDIEMRRAANPLPEPEVRCGD